MAKLHMAIPSKGRLKDQCEAFLETINLTLKNIGHERGYKVELQGIEGISLSLLSASEIAERLVSGELDMGITGEDLIHEATENVSRDIEFLGKLGFGGAKVIVAIADSWFDIRNSNDLYWASEAFYREHGYHMRVATKYFNLTSQYFKQHDITRYQLIHSHGATEGAPAAGSAEIIVDITSTGATLLANHLRILDDGDILDSEANLILSKNAKLSLEAQNLLQRLCRKFALSPDFKAR